VLGLCARGVSPRFRDAHRIDVHPNTAGSESLRRGDDDAAVTAPEVVHDIVRRDLREPEHPVDDVRRRGDVGCPGHLQCREGE